MKIRSSTKIGIGFAALVSITCGAYYVGIRYAVRNENFSPVVPGKVNLVGIDPGAGYQIIVANQMAQLVQASDQFGGKETADGGATEGAIKKRIPVKELLGVLRGDTEAVGPFVMTMNEMSENDLPPVAPVWKAEDLRKALDGDKALEAKLVTDLNMKLDGTPLSKLRISSLENGIIVDSPVPVHILYEGQPREVVGRVKEAYRPRLMRAVETRYADKANLTREMQAGYYQEEAAKVLAGDQTKEDIRRSLESIIDPGNAKHRAETAERVIRSASVVVNEKQINAVSSREYDTSDGKRYDITIGMTDEGRRRLWKYSLNRVGTHLLLISDGVAIAAPRIRHDLAQGEYTITQMQDAVLVRDAVESLKEHMAK